ncbi:hypothetical protein BDZ45DRAFT_689227 [Acephala macrosclerotiorum]|nr:hypothetical protein BDZ45DRAFT_689227 [Acephala macrosclerotiorum]
MQRRNPRRATRQAEDPEATESKQEDTPDNSPQGEGAQAKPSHGLAAQGSAIANGAQLQGAPRIGTDNSLVATNASGRDDVAGADTDSEESGSVSSIAESQDTDLDARSADDEVRGHRYTIAQTNRLHEEYDKYREVMKLKAKNLVLNSIKYKDIKIRGLNPKQIEKWFCAESTRPDNRHEPPRSSSSQNMANKSPKTIRTLNADGAQRNPPKKIKKWFRDSRRRKLDPYTRVNSSPNYDNSLGGNPPASVSAPSSAEAAATPTALSRSKKSGNDLRLRLSDNDTPQPTNGLFQQTPVRNEEVTINRQRNNAGRGQEHDQEWVQTAESSRHVAGPFDRGVYRMEAEIERKRKAQDDLRNTPKLRKRQGNLGNGHNTVNDIATIPDAPEGCWSSTPQATEVLKAKKVEKSKKAKPATVRAEPQGINTRSNQDSTNSEQLRKLQEKIEKRTARARTLRGRLRFLKSQTEGHLDTTQQLLRVQEEIKQLKTQLQELQGNPSTQTKKPQAVALEFDAAKTTSNKVKEPLLMSPKGSKSNLVSVQAVVGKSGKTLGQPATNDGTPRVLPEPSPSPPENQLGFLDNALAGPGSSIDAGIDPEAPPRPNTAGDEELAQTLQREEIERVNNEPTRKRKRAVVEGHDREEDANYTGPAPPGFNQRHALGDMRPGTMARARSLAVSMPGFQPPPPRINQASARREVPSYHPSASFNQPLARNNLATGSVQEDQCVAGEDGSHADVIQDEASVRALDETLRGLHRRLERERRSNANPESRIPLLLQSEMNLPCNILNLEIRLRTLEEDLSSVDEQLAELRVARNPRMRGIPHGVGSSQNSPDDR